MEDVPLPFLLVEVLPHDCLLLSSPVATSIVTIKEGEVLCRIEHTSALQAPRCSAVAAVPAAASSSTNTIVPSSDVDCVIALLDDEKDLKVYRVSGLAERKASFEEVFSASLPKRGVKMEWEVDEKDMRLVIGDRHGDIRSFSVPLDSDSPQHKAKRQKVENRNNSNESNEDVEEEGIDTTNPPHLGHASMLTDFILTSFTEPSSQSPAKFIITSDRDEHIRISRWGKRRAGHLALRYLLGSQEAIGGLCVLEHKHLETLREGSTSEAKDSYLKQPLLFSTDSSRLRVWSLHRDREIGANRPDCLIEIDLQYKIRPCLKVNAKLERTRERTFAKGVSNSKKRQEQSLDFVEHIGSERDESTMTDCPIIIRRLSIMQSHNEVFLNFLVDGSSALFTIRLKAFFAKSTETTEYLSILDLGTPILDVAYYNDEKNQCIWLVHDVRRPKGQDHDEIGLKLARFDQDLKQWTLSTDSNYQVVQKQKLLRSRGTLYLANSLLLYDALCLYPKQDFELATNMKDAIAPNGLIRGGLANFERAGMSSNHNADTPNRGSNEKNMIKKVQMREEMLKRIEKSLGREEISS